MSAFGYVRLEIEFRVAYQVHDCLLQEAVSMEVDAAFGSQQHRQDLGRRDRVGEADPRRQDLRKRAEIDDTVFRAWQRAKWRDRVGSVVEPELAVRVIFNNEQVVC